MKSNGMLKIGMWIATFMVVLFSSCDIINPDEPNPTVLQLKPFEFQVKQDQGSSNNKISEVWVYANADFLGAFVPPVDIYYLEEGSTAFTFRPGIRNNGLANDAIVYPMFAGDTFELDAIPGEKIEFYPVTSYQPTTVFGFLADFELDNPFTDNRDTVAGTELNRTEVDAFEGDYSGQITLTKEADYIEVGHSVPISGFPFNGRPIYLEFRYKSEAPLLVGLLGINLEGQSFSQFFYLANPTEEWNMLYIELTDFIITSKLPAYKVLFSSFYPPGTTQPELNIFLDNIKVVYLAE